MITRNRKSELLRTLERLTALPERPEVIMVDNGSTDGTAEAVRERYPQVRLSVSHDNLGAAARNHAAASARTPYIAFCDDDIWWEPGALSRAADHLDRHRRLAAVTGRILVEPGGREDPIVAELRDSPLGTPKGLPGPLLGSILAGASAVRVEPFRAVGGFSPRLWLGGEEELLSVDLAARGWWLCYAPDVVVHHQPSKARDSTARRRLGIRNTLWFAWLRRPWPSALRRTWRMAWSVPRDRWSALAFCDAVRGLPWVLAERRVVPPEVEAGLRLLEEPQRRSAARRYVG
ncbi:MAG: glycosyltransferase [Catenulisporales bacterium]|nr:glycosyltransferase [Catenulisporales bacterium]